MSRVVVLRDELGEHERDEADFPLSIGRAVDADLRLPGRGLEEPLAYLGMHEGAPFLQPAEAGIPIFCNERLVESARWLEAGDTIRIETARITCELSDERVEFRVSDAAPAPREGPVLVLPPPTAQREEPGEELLPELSPPPRDRPRAGPATWLATAAAAGLLAVGWFLLTATAITLDVAPEPDELDVEGGWFAIELGNRFLLRPGDYELVARKNRYYDVREAIVVTREDNQRFVIRLELLPGLLTLATGDVTGARVSADGVALGVTPLVDAELVAGSHMLLIESERHLPETLELSVEGGGVMQRLDVVLTPAWSSFAFVSQPPGAMLLVDGEELGPTPITAELMAGEREVALALDGHETWYETLQVQADQPLGRREVLLALADATLRLKSAPAGASVTVDGRFRGRTPMELALVPDKKHRVELFKPGHERATRNIQFEPGETRDLSLRLVARRGEIEIVSTPPDAELFVDGASRGAPSQTLRLSAVPHLIEIRKEGYETFRTRVTPSPGIPERLTVHLATIEEAKTIAIAPVIVTGSGQEMRLIEPGGFDMGASRREQGRRSNEVQRSIVLTRAVYIATHEVTNREFREFAPGHSSGIFDRFSLDEDDQPVVRVRWEDAARYCNWLSQRDGLPVAYVERTGKPVLSSPVTRGYRLPTEAEWVWVARYAGGRAERKYPWGQRLPPRQLSGNYADTSARDTLPNVLTGYRDDFPVSSPPGSFPPNERGLHDLGGNVSEWVHDFYEVGLGGSKQETDPFGPNTGRYHVVRGSSWQDSSITELRFAYRDYGNEPRPHIGFRIARFAE